MMFYIGLPSECSSVIFSFLDLPDCLRVSETSLSMMREVMPTLNKRRMRMNERYCTVVEKKEIGAGRNMETEKVGKLRDMIRRFPTAKPILTPTTEEYVAHLSRSMPPGHPLCRTVQELNKEIRENISQEELPLIPLQFTRIFPIYQRILRPLKLYITLISRVIRSDPIAQHGDGKVTLDHYIGDVLCLTHLIHLENPNLLELRSPVSSLLHELKTRTCQGPSYISWVLLHCTILRTKTFSSKELERLGFSDERFLGGDPVILPLRCFVDDRFMSSQITMILDSFGSLGPSFRLRDDVHIHELSAHCIFAYLSAYDRIDEQGIRRGSAGEMASEWLCRAHEESRKVRPLSVRQPFVRFSVHF